MISMVITALITVYNVFSQIKRTTDSGVLVTSSDFKSELKKNRRRARNLAAIMLFPAMTAPLGYVYVIATVAVSIIVASLTMVVAVIPLAIVIESRLKILDKFKQLKALSRDELERQLKDDLELSVKVASYMEKAPTSTIQVADLIEETSVEDFELKINDSYLI